jgi:hypothetical protein
MSLTLVGSLVVLALIDSTSFGTLLIPLWLLASPRLRAGRILAFLATVAGFYAAAGALLLWGAEWALDPLVALTRTPAGLVVLLAAGVGLVVWSARLEKSAKAQRAGEAEPNPRTLRWRRRALGEDGGRGGLPSLLALALTAAAIELGTMLPYLAAIGSITAADLPTATASLALAGYCVVMVLPALVLLAARLGAARVVEPLLTRLEAWLTRNSAATLSWVVGIVGVLLVLNALQGGVLEGLPFAPG